MNLKWKFPSAGGGNISGLNDTGITQFKSVPIQSMTKETLQDSLDARASQDEPAIVKFSLFDLPRKSLPDIEGLTKIFEMGKKYWSGHNQQEAEKFFSRGLEVLQQDVVKVMAIQDFNTKGLSNIGGENGKNSGGWMALVRSTGITEKGPMASGSFGIGKHAPFATSVLQTVVYSTINEEDKYGFQGVSKIASYLDEDEDMTQGTGYYGYVAEKDFKPITDIRNVPGEFHRNERGTDKFILGFEEIQGWEFEVLKESISSFMLAIYEGHLEIYIDDKVINANTLKDHIAYIAKKEPDNLLLQFYEALTSADTKILSEKFQTDKGDEEEIKLYLLPREGFKKRIVLYRGTGMKIYDRGHFRTPIEFAGVLVVKGERLNAILRKMEPPTHDKWDPNLYKDNIGYAKKLRKAINDWMNKETRNLIDLSDIESVELTGLEKLLPDVTKKESTVVELDRKSLKQKIRGIKGKKRKKNPRKSGPVDKTGESGRSMKNDRKIEGDKPGEGSSGTGKLKRARILRTRVYCLDQVDGSYSIRFWPSTNGERTFQIHSIGENGSKMKLDIIAATDKETGKQIDVSESEIGPLLFKKNEMLEVHVTFKTRNKLALEVEPS